MKETMTVDLDRIRSAVEDRTIDELGDRFASPLSLGGGRSLLLTVPKELPIRKPDFFDDPFNGIEDVNGILADYFGGEYDACIMKVTPGTYVTASGDHPEGFDIDVSLLSGPHALVEVAWALNQPPTNVGVDSEFGQKHHAFTYYRIDHTDPDASFASDHGTDLWIMPMADLGPFQHAVSLYRERRDAEARLAIKRYLMSAPYYRELLERERPILELLGIRLVCGDEMANLCESDEASADSFAVYYDHVHLKCLRSTLQQHMMGHFIGGLGAFVMRL